MGKVKGNDISNFRPISPIIKQMGVMKNVMMVGTGKGKVESLAPLTPVPSTSRDEVTRLWHVEN